ncbi:MAG TPA: Na+-dependent transporter [Candidatus Methanomethylophilaceae archaeon]|nr:Na+-dependent transporter [Candidatus Methanomethylophilaceae archaeon]
MRIKGILASSAIMLSIGLILSILINVAGIFPYETLDAGVRSNITVLVLAIMMTISLSRIPFTNLDPVKHNRSVVRAVAVGIVIAAIVPLVGFWLMKDTSWSKYSVGLVFIAAAPFAASVVPLSYTLRGDMEHAGRGTIISYLFSLFWIPFIIYMILGEMVDMKNVIITVVEIIAIPLVLSRLLTKVKISRDAMGIMMNLFISFLVILSVSSTKFPNELAPLIIFAVIAALRTFGLGTVVEVTEKRMGISWGQRVTDVLMVSYRNKGIAIAMCIATLGADSVTAMVAIATSIVIEIIWVVFMDSVLYSKKRMFKETGTTRASEVGNP